MQTTLSMRCQAGVVAVEYPSRHFFLHQVDLLNSATEALAVERTQFDRGDIDSAGV